jgi:hypothetical protein
VQADSTYNTSTHVLQVSNGTTVDDLQFIGDYTQENLKFASDGHGGTIVYDPPVIDITGRRNLIAGKYCCIRRVIGDGREGLQSVRLWLYCLSDRSSSGQVAQALRTRDFAIWQSLRSK